MPERRLIVCADDFGRDAAVNEAVETAHRDGILTCASLMVAAPAAADAVARARRLRQLRVGLHLVLIDGAAGAAAGRDLGRLVRRDGRFDPTSGARRAPIFLLARHSASARGRDPRPVRGVSRNRARARPCQRAQAHASASDGRAADRRDRPRIRHARGSPAGRAGRVLRARLPGRALPDPAYQPAVAALRRRLRRAGLA